MSEYTSTQTKRLAAARAGIKLAAVKPHHISGPCACRATNPPLLPWHSYTTCDDLCPVCDYDVNFCKCEEDD